MIYRSVNFLSRHTRSDEEVSSWKERTRGRKGNCLAGALKPHFENNSQGEAADFFFALTLEGNYLITGKRQVQPQFSLFNTNVQSRKTNTISAEEECLGTT